MTPAEFAQALTEKFADEGPWSHNYFSVDPNGQKYIRIVQSDENGNGRSVHCFVDAATGEVLKSASWKTPAKGVRYATMEDAVEAADLYGRYLYVR